MHPYKWSQMALAVTAAAVLAACGGGGDEAPNTASPGEITKPPVTEKPSDNGGQPKDPVTDPKDPGSDGGNQPKDPVTEPQDPKPETPVKPAEGGHPLPLINYASAVTYQLSSFSASQAAFCPNAVNKAYGGHNTAVFAQPGISDEMHRKLAQYAEASVVYIKGKLNQSNSTEGFGDNQTISVCVKDTGSGGSGFYNALEVSPLSMTDEEGDAPDENLKKLVLHEMIHVMHARLAKCWDNNSTYGIVSKWFSEGSALYLAGQDRYYTGDLADMRKMSSENPYSWIENGYPVYERYPVYRLAVEALVDASGKTEDDLWKFTSEYFAANNSCNAQGYKTFNAAISQYFGNLLEDSNYIGNFWTTTLDKYALPE